MAIDEYGLTPKQRIFCDLYIQYGNASRAALEAGYSKKTAFRIGQENMQKPACKAYITERMKPKQDMHIASADEVLAFLTRVVMGLEKDQFGLDASLQDRIKASQELMKRYAVADQRQASTMARLDSLLVEFKTAISDNSVQPNTIVIDSIQNDKDS